LVSTCKNKKNNIYLKQKTVGIIFKNNIKILGALTNVGHFLFEKNKPIAAIINPFYAAFSDFRMTFELYLGLLPLDG
jgi:hypothetical protein